MFYLIQELSIKLKINLITVMLRYIIMLYLIRIEDENFINTKYPHNRVRT